MRSDILFIFATAVPVYLIFGVILSTSLTAATTENQGIVAADEYVFDGALFRGSSFNQETVLHLTQGESISPGRYKVDIYINNHFFEHRDVRFIQDAQQHIQACFNTMQLQRASIITLIPEKTAKTETETETENCASLQSLIGAGSSQFDFKRLRLNLTIPNSLIKQVPAGYVNPSEWRVGESIGFINYISNVYYNRYAAIGFNQHQDSAYLALNGGINFGQWQFRQQSNLNYQQHHLHWRNLRRYLKRPIPSLNSELALGQLSSTGRFFSGISFNGISLHSDDRMLPNSKQGYAPVIQGVAKSNARVSVQQNGYEIYQITVAPGPFKISDLFPTSANGDLNVIIDEADGSRSNFRVPFSAVAESVRLGAFKYSFDLGKTRDTQNDRIFANLTTQYGFSNTITLNSGFRIANHYQAIVLGSAYTHRIGAFGANLTLSRSTAQQQASQKGWMLAGNYSKTIQPTKTTIALSAYRVSNSGYLELTDLIRLDQRKPTGRNSRANFTQANSRFTLSVNQALGRFGGIYLSASAQQYRAKRPNDNQFQLGYSKSLANGLSINLTATRLKRGLTPTDQESPSRLPSVISNPKDQHHARTETSFGLSIAMPLGLKSAQKSHQLMLSAYHNTNQNDYQANLSGAILQRPDLHYSLGVNYEDASQQRHWNASIQKHSPNANIDVNAAMGQHFWQAAANIQGALAIHAGGITFGGYLSDTFALIEAQGAQGAKVLNTQDSTINSYGFALLPALTPYHYNTIALSPEGMSSQAELVAGQQRVAPYAGAAIKIKFTTHQGFAFLVQSTLADGVAVPMGADVFDQSANNIGIVGQNGQIYFRSEQSKGDLSIKWGENAQEACSIHYALTSQQIRIPLTKFSAICKVEQ